MASEKLMTFSKTDQDVYLSPNSSGYSAAANISASGGGSWFVSEEAWLVITRINASNNPSLLNIVFDNSGVIV